MMDRFLVREQLHRLLKDRGHAFWSAKPEDAPIDVSPPPDVYLTVGADQDGALKSAYRNEYFACVRGADEIPLVRNAPEFALSGPLAEAAEREPAGNDFIDGPARWLFARIRRFDQILFWPGDGFRGTDGLGFPMTTVSGQRITQLPHLANRLARHIPAPATAGAIVLSQSDVNDCRVLWEAANLVGTDVHNFYPCDLAGHEVYQMHHHDNVIVSVPDDEARWDLIDDLADRSDLFKDWSGYRSASDEEVE
jgi:hypothetical protein